MKHRIFSIKQQKKNLESIFFTICCIVFTHRMMLHMGPSVSWGTDRLTVCQCGQHFVYRHDDGPLSWFVWALDETGLEAYATGCQWSDENRSPVYPHVTSTFTSSSITNLFIWLLREHWLEQELLTPCLHLMTKGGDMSWFPLVVQKARFNHLHSSEQTVLTLQVLPPISVRW